MTDDRDASPTGAATGFDCIICLRLMHRPATLHCGHSFCQRCLAQCMRRSAICPTCRVDVPYEASHPQPSVALKEALTRLFPRESAARAAEEASLPPPAASAGVQSLPLFILEPLLLGQEMELLSATHSALPTQPCTFPRCTADVVHRVYDRSSLSSSHGTSCSRSARSASRRLTVASA